MKFGKGPVCALLKLKPLRRCTTLCVLLSLVVVPLILYHDPFLVLRRPLKPTEKNKPGAFSLDMETDSIDDMYDGCLSATASVIDQFGVMEWNFNGNFSYYWAVTEHSAKKPVHKNLKEEHAIVMYMYTKVDYIEEVFNQEVKTGKHMYGTHGFKFHYFYFYLTEAIQLLRHNLASCRTVYHNTWTQFDRNVIDANMRFGAFTRAASSKHSFDFNGNVSCFEIYSCFGADITYYSATDQMGQVLIPPYEVFKITHVLTNDPWCSVVYKLQSTEIPRSDLNCKLNQKDMKKHFEFSIVRMSTWIVLLILMSLVLVKCKNTPFVAAVLGALLVLTIVLVILN